MTVSVIEGDVYPITFTTSMDISTATAVSMTARLEGTGTAIVLPATVTGTHEVTHNLTGTLLPGRYRLAIRVTWPEAGPITFPSPGSEYLIVLENDLALPFALPSDLTGYSRGLVSATDSRSELILRGATKAIQNYAGWHIAPALDVTVILDGGTRELYLPTLKLNALTSVTVDGTAIDLADLEWSRNTGNVRRKDGCGFPEAYGSIEVVFNSGYATVPEELTQIVLQASSLALSSPTGATREQAGQVSMQWATTAPGVAGGLSLLERDYATLAKYVLPKVA